MTSAAPTRKTSAPRKRGDDTRAKIIDETVNCIVEEGFPAATAKHVAERAGVTWGVIQYHFGDRNGLLMAVVDDGVAKLLDSLSTAEVSDLPLPQNLAPRKHAFPDIHHSPGAIHVLQMKHRKSSGISAQIIERLLPAFP